VTPSSCDVLADPITARDGDVVRHGDSDTGTEVLAQSSFKATALGVTFIFGTYSATSTSRATPAKVTRNSARQVSHGP
jgi:hypothetical protein